MLAFRCEIPFAVIERRRSITLAVKRKHRAGKPKLSTSLPSPACYSNTINSSPIYIP
jgi:hypothetical protein